MEIHRYPDHLYSPESLQSTVQIMFTNFRPLYNVAGIRTGNAVASVDEATTVLYMPTNHAISDSFNYEPYSAAVATAIQESWHRRGDLSSMSTDESVHIAHEAIALGRIYGDKLGQWTVAAAGALGGSTAAGIVGAVAVGDVASQAQRGTTLARGRILNPKSYALFSSPNIRTFTFQFKFVPKSLKEAESTVKIIRHFRLAATPKELNGAVLEYGMPDYFFVRILGPGSQESRKGMVQLPEVVLTSITTTYNPNSLSYYTQNNMPVEVNLTLNFRETKPITREAIDRYAY